MSIGKDIVKGEAIEKIYWGKMKIILEDLFLLLKLDKNLILVIKYY